jgi:hypothetical protein
MAPKTRCACTLLLGLDSHSASMQSHPQVAQKQTNKRVQLAHCRRVHNCSYHRAQVLPFFEGLGFQLPERKGIADFLQEVTSLKDQEQYWRCVAGTPGRVHPVCPKYEIFWRCQH